MSIFTWWSARRAEKELLAEQKRRKAEANIREWREAERLEVEQAKAACGKCKFHKQYHQEHVGWCRRHPKQVEVPSLVHWCGEYVEKDQADEV